MDINWWYWIAVLVNMALLFIYEQIIVSNIGSEKFVLVGKIFSAFVFFLVGELLDPFSGIVSWHCVGENAEACRQALVEPISTYSGMLTQKFGTNPILAAIVLYYGQKILGFLYRILRGYWKSAQ